MKLRQEQKQKQILSQNMIQSVEILQMGAQELSEYIREMALENPVMEIQESHVENDFQNRIQKQVWLANHDEQNRAYLRYDQMDDEKEPMDNLGSDMAESLVEFLYQQLLGENYSKLELEIFHFIAYCLDERGYFTEPLHVISRQFHIEDEESQRYLNIMKELEPVGVCAGSLEECLTKQLEKDCEDRRLEIILVNQYLELIGKNQLHVIAKELRKSIEEIKTAVDFIKQLEPKPSRGFGKKEKLHYIVPDITIVRHKDDFEIHLNNDSYPTFQLRGDYLALLKTECQDEVKEYLYTKIAQAEKIQESLTRRNATLIKLVASILEVQKEFFLYEGKTLKSYRMMDAAEQIGVHESTISRAVKDKYLQCNWGIYPLSAFFTRGSVQTTNQEELAVSKVKQELRLLIEGEDKKKPYSDQKLADKLEENGIAISRRTVTKYREAMEIPNASKRKEF